MREVHAEHSKALQQVETELRELLKGELEKLNALAKEMNIANVIVPELDGTAKR